MNVSTLLALGAKSTLLLVMLYGCGGGGPPGEDIMTKSGEAARLAEVAASSTDLPTAYSVTFQDILSGGASFPYYSFPDASRGRVFDDQGQFAASINAPHALSYAILAPPVRGMGAFQEDWSYATGISPNGIFVGTTNSVEAVSRGFATFPQTADAYFMPPNTSANFISTSGLVGGLACPEGGQPPSCPDGSVQAVHWRPLTGDVTAHPGFEVVWMNDAGRMLGYRHLPDGTRRLATVDPDGVPREVGFEPDAGLPAHARFIADNGTIFLDVADDPVYPAPASAVVLIDECVPVVVGRVTVRPPICEQRECIERTRFRAFSASGHAVGEHAWLYQDDAGNWQFAAESGFHWSAKDGTTAIEGAGAGLPYLVNASGAVVVGGAAVRTPLSQDGQAEPHLWKKGAGAVALRSVLFPQPDVVMTPEDIVRVIALGDGGHLLVGLHTPSELLSFLLLFAPETGP